MLKEVNSDFTIRWDKGAKQGWKKNHNKSKNILFKKTHSFDWLVSACEVSIQDYSIMLNW